MTHRTTPDAERWISPGEAAKILGVSPVTVARLAEAGRIEFIRPGTHRRYRRDDVVALRESA